MRVGHKQAWTNWILGGGSLGTQPPLGLPPDLEPGSWTSGGSVSTGPASKAPYPPGTGPIFPFLSCTALPGVRRGPEDPLPLPIPCPGWATAIAPHSPGFNVALEVLHQVAAELGGRRQGGPPLSLLVTWVCQHMPGPELIALIQGAGVSTSGAGAQAQPFIILAVYVQPAQVCADRPSNQCLLCELYESQVWR